MDFLQTVVDFLNTWVVELGIPVGDEQIPFMVIVLIGTGFFLTVRTGFVQISQLGHGFAVASGRYDHPSETGDVSHFQALTTALSATVGIGNIAGVAIAIHWGGPGALVWMWITAAVGMATKYAEVALAHKYRHVEQAGEGAHKWEGTVSGGPMYYIEKGLGPAWKPMAVFFAVLLGFTAFLTGNAVQANTVADTMLTTFGVPAWLTGVVTAAVLGSVIVGGITRIGRVTAILAPLMAVIYVAGALFILLINASEVVPTFILIFREALNPSAGVAGAGMGSFLVTMMWGVRRGLFSNEAGQGSAPIAHAAAKTEEPISEGVVALLGPFIDTLVICSMTALVILITGVWDERHPTVIELQGGDLGWVSLDEGGRYRGTAAPAELRIENGLQATDQVGTPLVSWHEVALEELYLDPDHATPFTGTIRPLEGTALTDDGQTLPRLYAPAVESGAPLTMLGFQEGLPGGWGQYIVVFSVLLFAVSTAIAWSYYGDRCAYYLFGSGSVLPYKLVYVGMHFVGAVLPLAVVWAMGDVFLAIVIWPNLLALLLLSGDVKGMTESYLERKPWIAREEAHKRWIEARKAR